MSPVRLLNPRQQTFERRRWASHYHRGLGTRIGKRRIVGHRLGFLGANRSLGRWEAPERNLPPQQLPQRSDGPLETINRLFQLIQLPEIDDSLARPLQLSRNHGIDLPFQVSIDCRELNDIRHPLDRCTATVASARINRHYHTRLAEQRESAYVQVSRMPGTTQEVGHGVTGVRVDGGAGHVELME